MPLAGAVPMTLDLNDPESIVAWWRVAPGRHGPQLAAMAQLWPAFADSIKRAGEMIRAEREKK